MYSEIAANKRKTWLIMVTFMFLVSFVAWIVSSYIFNAPSATFVVLVIAAVYTIISYYSGTKMAAAVNGAKEISKSDNPKLYNIVENLSITNGMPMPKVYVIEDKGMNAFATGRNPENSLVAATTGLLNKLDKTEIEGVMAHELGHIKNYDIRVSMIAFALTSVISLIVDFGIRAMWFSGSSEERGGGPIIIVGLLVSMLAPLVAGLIRMSISRNREYLADATGALTTRYPEGLASALKKIDGHSSLQKQNSSTAHLFISNPLKSSSFSSLFSTHPPIEQRVERLMDMEDQV